MSGVKGRSGRRPDAQRVRCRALIGQALTDQDWVDIFAELARHARNGSAAHAKLLLAYMYGVPVDVPEAETAAPPISILEVHTD